MKSALSESDWAAAIYRGDFEYFADSEDDISSHGKAALYLYDQSYGFTWEDVDALHVSDDGYDDDERLQSIADRIQALLPRRIK